MRIPLARLALLAASASVLTGCAVLGIGPRQPRIAALSTLPTGAQAFVTFEQARAALDNGNNAAAIAAFSEARMEPELLAPSLNGMGVAYARLGRLDLAERYFRQAAAAAPGDIRFATNLARLRATLERSRLNYEAPVALAKDETSYQQGRNRVVLAGSGQLHLRQGPEGGPQIMVSQPEQRLARIDPARVELATGVSESPRNGAQVRIRFGEAAQVQNARDGEAGSASAPARLALNERPRSGAQVRIRFGEPAAQDRAGSAPRPALVSQ